MEVFSNDYVAFLYDEKKQMIEVSWKPTTAKFTDELFRESIGYLPGLLAKYKPTGHIGDLRNFFYAFPPETQKWVNSHVVSEMVKGGIKKSAFVVSSDIFAQVSVEQLFDEKTGLTTKYFKDIEAAREWIG